MNLENLEKILNEHKKASFLFKRNLIKEYLQVLVLSFIYSSKKYQKLIFYGGSCLRHCYNLPRLSEDLDFIDLEKVNLNELSRDLKSYFKKNFDIEPLTKIQKFRVYLKFPILYELNLAKKSESDFLILKIEVFGGFTFCKNYKIEVIPIFKFGQSFLIRTLDLSSLMSTKIRAILLRKWEKTDKKGKTLAKVKGRDYFDLTWYLRENIKPNLKCLGEKMTMEKLRERLLEIVKKIDKKSLVYDLEGLIEDRNFVKDLTHNIKEILIREIRNKIINKQ
jgi:predicted nucleotidyltransferase component of viral defense system